MTERNSKKDAFEPLKQLFTDLIDRNKQLTNEIEQIKTEMNVREQRFTQHLNQQKVEFQLAIYQLKQQLQQQVLKYQNEHQDHLDQLDTNLQNQILHSNQLNDLLNALSKLTVVSFEYQIFLEYLKQ